MTFSYLDQERLQDSPHAQCQQVGGDTSASQPRQAERQEVVEGVIVDKTMGTIGTGELLEGKEEKTRCYVYAPAARLILWLGATVYYVLLSICLCWG